MAKGLRKSISYWSFPGGLENRADIPAVLAQAKALGFAAVELGISDTGQLTLGTSRSECQALARAAAAARIEIASLATGLYWATSLTASKKEVRDKAIETTKLMLERARWLGTDALLVIPGAVSVFFMPDGEIVAYDQALARSRESLKQCVKFAEKQRVTLALENVWNKLLLSPLELRDFVDGFRSRRVGVYFDTGNVVVTGYPEQWIRILGRRIARVHLKDFKWRFQGDVNQVRGFGGFAAGQAWGTMAAFCDLGAGDVNWPAVMAAFRKAGYRGPLTAEMLPPAAGMLERTSAFMDKLLAM